MEYAGAKVSVLPHGVVVVRRALDVTAQMDLMESIFAFNNMHAKVLEADDTKRYWQLLMHNWPSRCGAH